MPRLKDRLAPDLRVMFVGINPGVRSALSGHHFAGYSNRFWKLLFDAGLVPEAITYKDDDRLHEWGFSITNLVPRATPGIDTIDPAEYAIGLKALRRKVRKYRPAIVALIGVSLARSILAKKGPIALGEFPERFEGVRVFVLPNPSGRNANFTYAQMRDGFAHLSAALARR